MAHAYGDHDHASSTGNNTAGTADDDDGYSRSYAEDSYVDPDDADDANDDHTPVHREVPQFDNFPRGFRVELKTSVGFGVAMGIVWIDTKRALVLEKDGHVWICEPDTPGFPRELYMVIPSKVLYKTDETGALAINVDPDFNAARKAQKFVYIYYGASAGVGGLAGGMRLSKFKHVENKGGLESVLDYASEQVLWHDTDGWGVSPQWHYGGAITFGPTKKLFLTLGDKYTREWQISNKHHSGCIIRVNRDGSIPAGNLPPAIKPAACWAYGIRNGFSAYWDTPTNRFLIAEVGGNKKKTAQEDVHLGKGGVNYGWPYCEGHCNNVNFPDCSCDKHDDPIYTYDHSQYPEEGEEGTYRKGAIIGGVVLRNSAWPAQYYGAYFHADFSRGDLSFMQFEHDGSEKVRSSTRIGNIQNPIRITKGPDNNLWITTYKGRKSAIFKISYASTNKVPVISAVFASVLTGPSPLRVAFIAAATDPDGANEDLEYMWLLGDGTTLNGQSAVHTYTTQGTFAAQMFVSDGEATVGSYEVLISVGSPPTVNIVAPMDGQTFRAGETLALKGAGTYLDDYGSANLLPNDHFQWHLGFIHDSHVHPIGTDPAGSTATYTVPNSGHRYGNGTGLKFELTATSPGGKLRAVAEVKLWPELTVQRFESNPSGLHVKLDSDTFVTPFEIETVVGFEHQFELQDTYCYKNSQHERSKISIAGPYNRSTSVVHVPAGEETVLVDLDATRTAGGARAWCADPPVSLCAMAAFDAKLTLNCSSEGEGYTIASVTFASFGVPDSAACYDGKEGSCHASTSRSVVEAACLGHSECSVDASFDTFGTECSPDTKSLSAFTGIGAGWCRGQDQTRDTTGIFQQNTYGTNTVELCMAACLQDLRCTGIWYNAKSYKCQLHAIELVEVRNKNNVQCYVRKKDVVLRSLLATVVCEQQRPITTSSTTGAVTTATATTTTVTTATATTATVTTATATTTTVTTATVTMTVGPPATERPQNLDAPSSSTTNSSTPAVRDVNICQAKCRRGARKSDAADPIVYREGE